MADCVTLWIGEALGAVERACLRSVLRQGHSIALYCYRAPKGVPAEVELCDASEILPEDRILRHANGSVALFSDWFRYELQRRRLGTWIDTDVYFVAPLDLQQPYLLAEYEPGKINGCVLRLPADSPILPLLLEPFEKRTVPRGMRLDLHLRARFQQLVHGDKALARMPWGSAGPYPLTGLAKRFGLLAQAQPPEVFHPAEWRNAHWIKDPGIRLEDVITDRTVGVHLWNECIKAYKDAPARAGSFLARLHEEGRK